MLADATKVEVFRIDGKDGPFDDRPKLDGQVRIYGYLVTRQEQDLGKEFAKQLEELLGADDFYSTRAAGCFFPGVAFRVWSSTKSVDILICLECSNLLYGPQPEFKTPSFLDSPRRTQLVRLTKEAFPTDQEIQSLRE